LALDTQRPVTAPADRCAPRDKRHFAFLLQVNSTRLNNGSGCPLGKNTLRWHTRAVIHGVHSSARTSQCQICMSARFFTFRPVCMCVCVCVCVCLTQEETRSTCFQAQRKRVNKRELSPPLTLLISFLQGVVMPHRVHWTWSWVRTSCPLLPASSPWPESGLLPIGPASLAV